jgi:hypothetical protein
LNTDNILGDIGEEDDNSSSSKKKSEENKIRNNKKKKSTLVKHLKTSPRKRTGNSESSIMGAADLSSEYSSVDSENINDVKSKKVFLTSKIFTNERMLEMRTSVHNIGPRASPINVQSKLNPRDQNLTNDSFQ